MPQSNLELVLRRINLRSRINGQNDYPKLTYFKPPEVYKKDRWHVFFSKFEFKPANFLGRYERIPSKMAS